MARRREIARRKIVKKIEPSTFAFFCAANPELPPEEMDWQVFRLYCAAQDGELGLLQPFWQACREQVLKVWTADHPGSRPWAFWLLDADIEPPASQVSYLADHGLLTTAERTALGLQACEPGPPHMHGMERR